VLGLVLLGANELRLAAEQRAEDRRIAAAKLVEQKRETERLEKIQKAEADVKAFRLLAAEAHRLFALQQPSSEQFVSTRAERTERKAVEAVKRLRPWGPDLAELPLQAERPALKQQLYEVLLILAETRTHRGKRREAARDVLALLDQAAALRPASAAHLCLQADCYLLLGEQPKAKEARQRAADPKMPVLAFDHYFAAERLRADHARAVAGREKQSWTNEQKELFDRVVEEYRAAVRSDYNYFWAHHQLSQCYLTLRKEDLALNEADICLALEPNSPWGYTLRGQLEALLRRFGKARADLEQAMKLGPSLRDARMYRGLVNWLEKNYDAALMDFDAVLKPPAEQRLLEAAFYRGQLHLERRQEDKALADFDLVIERWPAGHPASLRRARIYFGRGDVKRGMADLNAFLNRGGGFDPNSPEIYAERGRRMRLMVGELPRKVQKAHLTMALAQLEQAVHGGARTAVVYDELGAVREHLGMVSQAIEAYTEAVKHSPKEARLRVKRAWAHEKLENYAQAADDFAAAIKLDPSYAEAYAGLGYVQACRGQAVAGASSHAAEAVLLGGGDYLLLHNVACVYGKLSARDPKRAREFQDLALVYLRREVELWRRDRTGPDPRLLIRGETAFPVALRQRPEFNRLFEQDR
jgi:tetratricopeptide (TPR) repeat protein